MLGNTIGKGCNQRPYHRRGNRGRHHGNYGINRVNTGKRIINPSSQSSHFYKSKAQREPRNTMSVEDKVSNYVICTIVE